MIFLGTRSDAEKALAKALARYIGYTTGAYDLSRIVSILDCFAERASAYKEEIIAALHKTEDVKPQGAGSAYLAEIINFTQAMGLISTVSSRETKLQRFAPTETGRSVLGAKAAGDPEFYRFFLARTVMLADADYLYPVMKYYSASQSEHLHEFFVTVQTAIRQERVDWLFGAFPERVLRDRIVDHVSWFTPPRGGHGEPRVDIPSRSTARHHATPRQGWLQELGILDESTKSLTAFGHDVLRALEPTGSYFWLGPESTVQDALRISPDVQKPGPFEDRLDIARLVSPPSGADIQLLLDDLYKVMVESFASAKLVHAAQASLKLPIEFIRYRSYHDQKDYNWVALLDTLFHEHRSELERFSAHKGLVGFYRVK